VIEYSLFFKENSDKNTLLTENKENKHFVTAWDNKNRKKFPTINSVLCSSDVIKKISEGKIDYIRG